MPFLTLSVGCRGQQRLILTKDKRTLVEFTHGTYLISARLPRAAKQQISMQYKTATVNICRQRDGGSPPPPPHLYILAPVLDFRGLLVCSFVSDVRKKRQRLRFFHTPAHEGGNTSGNHEGSVKLCPFRTGDVYEGYSLHGSGVAVWDSLGDDQVRGRTACGWMVCHDRFELGKSWLESSDLCCVLSTSFPSRFWFACRVLQWTCCLEGDACDEQRQAQLVGYRPQLAHKRCRWSTLFLTLQTQLPSAHGWW